MTVNSADNRVQYNGNGATTAFAFAKPVFDQSHLVVTLTDTATNVDTLQVITTNYTVALASDFSSATVTMLAAPATGKRLTIERVVPYTQLTDLIENNAFLAATVERQFDLLAMMAQQIKDITNRSPLLAASTSISGIPNLVLDPPVAGAFLQWDATATKITTSATLNILSVNTYTSGQTMAATDANKLAVYNSASGGTFTIPANATTAYQIGTQIIFYQQGAGQLTIAAAGGVTINSAFSRLKLNTQHSVAGITKIATDTWILTGDLST